MYRRFETFRNEAPSNPQVRSVSAGTNVPSKNLNYYTQMWVRNRKEKDGLHAAQVAVDYEYFATLQAKIVSGRDFSREHKTDETEGVIINSEAAKELGLMNPVGSELSGINNASDPQTVIGVVDDIHFMSFREKVEPTVFFLRQWSANTIVLRLSGNDIPATMAFLERTWGTLVPDHPFIYSFLDQSFDRLYRSDQQTSTMILVFCVFAILLSSIGLYSIVSLLAQMRKKEIGVRKVLGASLTDVLFLTTSEYLVIVLVANIFAWPLAYYVMNRWLQDFAYRIDLTWTTFASAGGIALIVALLTVSVQSIRAGLANPVDSLRTE
jgi:putative ABC transport system permease protein